MSNAARRLSMLRRDLHEWRDALADVRDRLGNPMAIRPSDIVQGVDRILEADQGRIGQRSLVFQTETKEPTHVHRASCHGAIGELLCD